MTMSLSLEEQKKILLDRMEDNRRNYRSDLVQQSASAENSRGLANHSEAFPRSHTFKLLMQHPYFIGIALFVSLTVSRGSLRNILKQNMALGRHMLTSKVKTLVVPAIIRLFRSYIRF